MMARAGSSYATPQLSICLLEAITRDVQPIIFGRANELVPGRHIVVSTLQHRSSLLARQLTPRPKEPAERTLQHLSI